MTIIVIINRKMKNIIVSLVLIILANPNEVRSEIKLASEWNGGIYKIIPWNRSEITLLHKSAVQISTIFSSTGSFDHDLGRGFQLYIDGEKAVTLKGDKISEEFQALVDDYVAKTYAPGVVRKAGNRRKEIPIKQVG